ncbi:MAG TPA: glycerol-3-phosphate 1-O-acyltransferase PlsY [Hyphomicrobiaceae bacterium]|nr:glycerol-3-phosphate 1-O-acyltransferase PlsY [Hyphomicrobiaceae bacterium]
MDLSSISAFLVAAGIGYLFGSIPFGLLLTRSAGLGDIRAIGSGNIGATNVLRTGNKALAAATLAGDLLKGTAGVIAGAYLAGFIGTGAALTGFPLPVHAAAISAFLGHLFPVWLGFRGGKGVATYIGVALALFWPAALVFMAIWLASALLSRYSSFSALSGAAVAPIAPLLIGGTGSGPSTAFVLAALSVVLALKHKANIDRLLSGAEPKIGRKA